MEFPLNNENYTLFAEFSVDLRKIRFYMAKFQIDYPIFNEMMIRLNLKLNEDKIKKLFVSDLIMIAGLKCDKEEIGKMDRYIEDAKQESAKNQGKPVKFIPHRAEIIAKLIGFDSFDAFKNQFFTPISNQLKELCGIYYSVVRHNSEPVLLCSKVEIKLEDGKLTCAVYSLNRIFTGEIIELGDNIYIHLISDDKRKAIQWIYKIGASLSPKMLKGVYAGISSGNDPIAGRVILVRWQDDKPFPFEKGLQVDASGRDKPDFVWDEVISYFSDYSKNVIKIVGVSSFGRSDLK